MEDLTSTGGKWPYLETIPAGGSDWFTCHSLNLFALLSLVLGVTFFLTSFSLSVLFSASSGLKTRSRILDGLYDSGIFNPLIILLVFSVLGNWGMCRMSFKFSWVLSLSATFTGYYRLLLMQFCHWKPFLFLSILSKVLINPVIWLYRDSVCSRRPSI